MIRTSFVQDSSLLKKCKLDNYDDIETCLRYLYTVIPGNRNNLIKEILIFLNKTPYKNVTFLKIVSDETAYKKLIYLIQQIKIKCGEYEELNYSNEIESLLDQAVENPYKINFEKIQEIISLLKTPASEKIKFIPPEDLCDFINEANEFNFNLFLKCVDFMHVNKM
jgi:hypothetical protein